jgi:hypothetical protein
LLALSALVLSRSRGATWFFALAGAAWFVHRPLRDAEADLSPWAVNAVVWSAPLLFAFSIAVLAAFALDQIAAGQRAASARLALVVTLCGAGFLWIFRERAATLATEVMPAFGPEDPAVFARLTSRAHVDLISATFFAGLLCVVLASAMRPGAWRSTLVLATALAIFAQTGWLLRTTHPTAPERMLYPRTEAVEKLAKATEGKTFFVHDTTGPTPIPADTHVALGLRQLALGEPASTRRCSRLLGNLLPADGARARPKAVERALQIFGVELVLERNRWDDVDLAAGGAAAPGAPFPSAEILPEAPIVQRFVDRRASNTPFGFQWITGGSRNECTFTVTIEDAQTGEVFVRQVFAPGELRPRGQKQMPCSIEFPEEKRKSGRRLALRIESGDAAAGRAWSVLCRTHHADVDESEDPDWRAEQGGKPIEGRIALQPDDDPSPFLFEEQIAGYALRRVPGAARFRTVGRAHPTANEAESMAVVQRPAFDPRTMVVLEGADAAVVSAVPVSEEVTRPEIVSEVNGRVLLRANRATPGWLVASIAWYPGWRARLNGREVPIYCANHAFTGLALPAGENLVELEFAPRSVRDGAWMSGVGLLGLLGMLGAGFAARRRAK